MKMAMKKLLLRPCRRGLAPHLLTSHRFSSNWAVDQEQGNWKEHPGRHRPRLALPYVDVFCPLGNRRSLQVLEPSRSGDDAFKTSACLVCPSIAILFSSIHLIALCSLRCLQEVQALTKRGLGVRHIGCHYGLLSCPIW